MSIERDFDVTMIAGLALREKQIQQNYRPIIGVHKWFARRPGTLFRGLLLAEFADRPLQDSFLPVKSFLWVKTLDCTACGEAFDLFPGYLLAANRRHPNNVILCWACGDLNAVTDRSVLGSCATCGEEIRLAGPARRGRCDCPHCGFPNAYPRAGSGPLQHRMFAIEYHNSRRRGEHRGRFFKRPDAEDLARAEAAAQRWEQSAPRFVPDDAIPSGDETDRLHRWGYSRYRDTMQFPFEVSFAEPAG